jgi:hypothetical protein
MRFRHSARRIFIAPALGLALAAAVAACSSGGSSTSTTPPATSPATTPATNTSSATPATGSSGSAAAIAAIKANWAAFFSSSTPDSKRVELLQNGQTFASAVSAFSKSPLASAVSAKVDSVTVTSPTQATVKYDLTAAGTSVASGATGNAVLQDGTWKVGDGSFCGLLQEGSSILSIPVPAACKSAG